MYDDEDDGCEGVCDVAWSLVSSNKPSTASVTPQRATMGVLYGRLHLYSGGARL